MSIKRKVDQETVTKPDGATVVMAWSEPNQDRYGDEYLEYFVSFADDDGEPVGKCWKLWGYGSANKFANDLYDAFSSELEDLIIELDY